MRFSNFFCKETAKSDSERDEETGGGDVRLTGEEQTLVWLCLAVSPLAGEPPVHPCERWGLDLRIFKASPNANTSILQLKPLP